MRRMSDQRTALVLGAGGITGVAWEIGVLAGLADAGVDLTGADLVVGTSAGSLVGAQIACGGELGTLFERQLQPPGVEPPARLRRSTMAQWGWAMLRSRRDDVAFRRRIGALALAEEQQAGATPAEEERLRVIGSRLVSTEWPGRPLVITAVDAQSGEFRTFDRDSGVPLVQAVAASCAVPCVYPPVTIDGRRYIDGGMRSAANADLAEGFDRVVVLAPMDRFASMRRSERAALGNSAMRLVAPDEASMEAIGPNLLDASRRSVALAAGLAQGAALAHEIRAIWA